MRRFEIVDGSRRHAYPCAVLNLEYGDTENAMLSIDIAESAGENDVPMLFVPFVRENKRHINDKWTNRWIEERVVPSSRQNLGEVLRANNLEFYDAVALFIAGDGKCEQDDFFIREILPKEDSDGQSAQRQVGEAIRAARTSAGMTQYELARAAKITQPALSNLENGHANPTLGLLDDIASALGKKVDVRFV